MKKRSTSEKELDEVIEYWANLPRGSDYHNKDSLIRFLGIFTPSQIKGGMFIAKSTGRQAYFRYLCGILQNWKKDLEDGKVPKYFEVED